MLVFPNITCMVKRHIQVSVDIFSKFGLSGCYNSMGTSVDTLSSAPTFHGRYAHPQWSLNDMVVNYDGKVRCLYIDAIYLSIDIV